MQAPYPHRVTFHRVTDQRDEMGVGVRVPVQVHAARAKMIYKSGGESVSGGALQATGGIKVLIRRCPAALELTPADVMRDDGGRVYNIRSIDAVTDSSNVWIDVEHGARTEQDGVLA